MFAKVWFALFLFFFIGRTMYKVCLLSDYFGFSLVLSGSVVIHPECYCAFVFHYSLAWDSIYHSTKLERSCFLLSFFFWQMHDMDEREVSAHKLTQSVNLIFIFSLSLRTELGNRNWQSSFLSLSLSSFHDHLSISLDFWTRICIDDAASMFVMINGNVIWFVSISISL